MAELSMEDDFERAKDLFEWNKRVFDIIGVWPMRSTYIKFTVCIIYLLLHWVMVFADLYDVFGNLEEMVLNLPESSLQTMLLIKLMVMRFSPTLVKLMKRIIDGIDAKLFDSVEERKIYLNYNRTAKTFLKLWLTMGTTTAVVYHLKPLEYRLKAVLLNESMPFVLPYRTYLFFEVNDSRTFWLIWIYTVPVIYTATLHTATIAYLFSLVLHVCGQLSVLTFRIKNLKLSHGDNKEATKMIFRDIVNRHRNILDLAKDINDVFGLILLEELLISILLMVITWYNMLVNVDFQETAVFLSFLLYGLTLLLLIYGYCIAGEFLITESTNLYGAYYHCRWYDMPDAFKKQLIICMIGASKPIQLTAGGFYIFSLFNFTGILKTSGGYISMLRTMI